MEAEQLIAPRKHEGASAGNETACTQRTAEASAAKDQCEKKKSAAVSLRVNEVRLTTPTIFEPLDRNACQASVNRNQQSTRRGREWWGAACASCTVSFVGCAG